MAPHFTSKLLITGGKFNGAPVNRFWLAGGKIPYSGNGLLVGTNLMTGDTADHPAMAIDQFRDVLRWSNINSGRLPRHADVFLAGICAEHLG